MPRKYRPSTPRRVHECRSVNRGVLKLELLFVYATIADHRPRQIVESGRYLGQSTRLLSLCYPDIPIVSIEYDADSPVAPQAIERLRDRPNVAPLFGNSRELLPRLTLPGDVVVIDGPKDLRALRLALETIVKRRPAMVFIHDCYKGTAVRRFLDRHLPETFYCDHPQFVARFHDLDLEVSETIRRRWHDPAQAPTDRSYSHTFACLVPSKKTTSTWLRLRLKLERALFLQKKSLNKRLGGGKTDQSPDVLSGE